MTNWDFNCVSRSSFWCRALRFGKTAISTMLAPNINFYSSVMPNFVSMVFHNQTLSCCRSLCARQTETLEWCEVLWHHSLQVALLKRFKRQFVEGRWLYPVEVGVSWAEQCQHTFTAHCVCAERSLCIHIVPVLSILLNLCASMND